MMASLKISYTDTTSSSSTDTITVTLSNIRGNAGSHNSPNPISLKTGEHAYWSYTGAQAGFTFTVTDFAGNPIPDLTNVDGSKKLPKKSGDKQDGYTLYINDSKNPPTDADVRTTEDSDGNGVKVTRP